MKKILVLMIVTGLLFATGAYSQEAKKKSLGGAPVKSTEEVKKDAGKKELPKTTVAPAKTDTKKAKSAKPLKGKVVSFTNVIMGKAGSITKDEAIKMADKGDPIVFMVGDGKKGKIYFVYNTDGTFGGKNLAKYANNKNVGIVGKTKTVNGINYIVAEMIESMD